MAKVKYIIAHCTATPEGREVTREDIRKWHIKGRGWSRVGYAFLIKLDGEVVMLQWINDDDQLDPWEITNGVRGENGHSVHFVYAGGTEKYKPAGAKWHPPKDTRNEAQLKAMEWLVKKLLKQFPDAKLAGHNQFANKACPSFDVPQWAESIGISRSRVKR